MREGKTYSLPLGEREVVEGNIDIFVGSLRIHINHKPLTRIPQIRLKPEVLVGDGFLKSVVETHNMLEINVHHRGFAASDSFDLRLVIELRPACSHPIEN